jgi:hypothetical protein
MPVIVTDVAPAVGPELGLTEVTVGAPSKVYWSAVDVLDVPNELVIVMSTVPADSAGVTAVICVAEVTVKLPAALEPNFTAVANVKLVPVMVTVAPPAIEPAVGITELTLGIGTNVNWSADEVADVPPTVITVTSTVPVLAAGVTAVMDMGELTVKLVALVEPKLTVVAPVKLVPAMVTEVPPPVDPVFGVTEETVGAATYVNWSAADVADVPTGVVTVTSTVPGDPAGLIAVIVVDEVTRKLVEAVEPKVTPVAPVRLAPVIVTELPPAAMPAVGLIAVTVGEPS